MFISQSNYVPWKGYFDAIHHCDEFVLYDDVQYTKNDWRNRNRIKTPRGCKWLTIPVETSGRFGQTVGETRVSGHRWTTSHWDRLRASYADAPCFAAGSRLLAPLYDEAASLDRLSDVNHLFLRAACDFLGIGTRFHWSHEFGRVDDRTQNLVDICARLGADEYWSGPAARAYLEESRFDAAGIEVRYFDYAGYPEYPQLHPPFEHAVSIVDLIFNVGDRATDFMRSFGPQAWAALSP